METLQIKKENALKAFNEGCNDVKNVLSNLFGKETFIPKNITDRVKTFEDACEVLGIRQPEFEILDTGGIAQDFKSIVAYTRLIIIVRALNEGWTPDWSNSSQYKYYPYFKTSSGSGLAYHGFDGWDSGTFVGSRLCFKSRELAEYAGKQFQSIYNDFLNL